MEWLPNANLGNTPVIYVHVRAILLSHTQDENIPCTSSHFHCLSKHKSLVLLAWTIKANKSHGNTNPKSRSPRHLLEEEKPSSGKRPLPNNLAPTRKDCQLLHTDGWPIWSTHNAIHFSEPTKCNSHLNWCATPFRPIRNPACAELLRMRKASATMRHGCLARDVGERCRDVFLLLAHLADHGLELL